MVLEDQIIVVPAKLSKKIRNIFHVSILYPSSGPLNFHQMSRIGSVRVNLGGGSPANYTVFCDTEPSIGFPSLFYLLKQT
jgi:hypothetical protein